MLLSSLATQRLWLFDVAKLEGTQRQHGVRYLSLSASISFPVCQVGSVVYLRYFSMPWFMAWGTPLEDLSIQWTGKTHNSLLNTAKQSKHWHYTFYSCDWASPIYSALPFNFKYPRKKSGRVISTPGEHIWRLNKDCIGSSISEMSYPVLLYLRKELLGRGRSVQWVGEDSQTSLDLNPNWNDPGEDQTITQPAGAQLYTSLHACWCWAAPTETEGRKKRGLKKWPLWSRYHEHTETREAHAPGLDYCALSKHLLSFGKDQQLQDGSSNWKHSLREVAPIKGCKVPSEGHLSN